MVVMSEDGDQEYFLDDSTTVADLSFSVAVQLDHPVVSSTPFHFTSTILTS